LRLKVGIDRNEEAGGAYVNSGLCIVEPYGQDFRPGDTEKYLAPVLRHILRAQLSEVYTGDYFPVNEQQKSVSSEEVGKNVVFALSRDDLVQAVIHCFQSLQLLDPVHYSRLTQIDSSSPTENCGPHTCPGTLGSATDEDNEQRSGNKSQHQTQKQTVMTAIVGKSRHESLLCGMAGEALLSSMNDTPGSVGCPD